MGFEKTSLLHFWFCSHCPLLNFLWRQRLLGLYPEQRLRWTPSSWYGKPWNNIAIKTQKMFLRKHKHVVVVVVLVKWFYPSCRNEAEALVLEEEEEDEYVRARARAPLYLFLLLFLWLWVLSPPCGCGLSGVLYWVAEGGRVLREVLVLGNRFYISVFHLTS